MVLFMVQHLKTQWHIKKLLQVILLHYYSGNEGEGVNPELLAHTTQNLIIPIYGKAESLNVAIAGQYFTLSFERLTVLKVFRYNYN